MFHVKFQIEDAPELSYFFLQKSGIYFKIWTLSENLMMTHADLNMQIW